MTAIVRARSVAVTLHADKSGDRAFMLRLLKEEGQRRADATVETCHLALMAYEEGADRAIGRLLQPTVCEVIDYRQRDALLPGYTEMRDFLIGELDAHELIACRVAHSRIVSRNRYRVRHEGFEAGRERGWL